MPRRKRFFQNTVALIYDFDGTLSPQPMQEYTVLPKIGATPKKFWQQVKKETKAQKAIEIVTYMRMMYEAVEAKKLRIARKDLKALAKGIKYYPGVKKWFSNVNRYVRSRSRRAVKVRHYIISSGLVEILEGTSIYKHLQAVYGSEYFFDHYGRATFVNRVITDTSKTQYLFRINKGKEDLADDVNQHMPHDERPVPFKNMVYFGDGDSDVPSMAVTREQGGHAIAVYGPHRQRSKCKDLLFANRIDFFAAADYRAGRELWKKTTLLLDKIINTIAYDRARYYASQERSRGSLSPSALKRRRRRK
jgi:phosphoserine phosphatase